MMQQDMKLFGPTTYYEPPHGSCFFESKQISKIKAQSLENREQRGVRFALNFFLGG